ncbi:N-6 DNA methylase [Planotetraspora thailandica]
MVAASDIARLADVGRAAVSNWRRRYEDFPTPAGGTATSPLFLLSEVETWLARHGKGFDVSLGDRIWQRLRATGDDLRLGETVGSIGAFLLYLQRDPTGWSSLTGQGDETLAEKMQSAITAAVPELPGVFFADIDPVIIRQVAEFGAEQGHCAAFDFICDRYVDAHSRRLLVTPQDVADLMIELADVAGGSVLDPACGLGTLLTTVGDSELLLGQEIGQAPARITAARLLLRGHAVEISAADSLRSDAFPGRLVDAVVCNPPFSERAWGYEELVSDPRWEYGLPPRGEPELAWLQHCLAHVHPGRRVVIMMPAVAASRRSGRRIRANLLRSGALRAVITVTAGAGASSQAPDLWVLRRPVPSERPPFHVLMVDASTELSIAAPAWAAFSKDSEGTPDLPERCRALPLLDLLDDDVDISPSRHVGPTTGHGEAFTSIKERALSVLGRVGKIVPDLAPATAHRDVPMTTIGELVKTGAITLHQAPLKTDTSSGDLPALTAKDVRVGRPPTGRGAAGPGAITTRPGDVVVPALVSETVARVLEEGGAVLGPQLYLFRVDRTRVDPYFLAGFIRTAGSAGTARASSASTRIDPRRAPIPRVPLEDQQRYGEAFRRLGALEDALREVRSLGESLVRLGFDSLADGSLQP